MPFALSPEDRTSSIIKLLTDHGSSDYIGEPVTQLAHSLQCAHLAAVNSGDSEMIVAALLHDIGQFLPPSEVEHITGRIHNMSSEPGGASVGRVGHESIGAKYLSNLGFSPKVSALVGSHVEAKRYLCAVDPVYYESLSDASKKSLEFQGGPLNGKELEEWSKRCLIDEMCQLRRWDDGAKTQDLHVEGLDAYKILIEDHLKRQEIVDMV